MTTIAPVHPGEILMEEFLSRCTSARTGSPATAYHRRINEIVHASAASLLTRRPTLRFGTTDRFWLNLRCASTSRSRDSGRPTSSSR